MVEPPVLSMSAVVASTAVVDAVIDEVVDEVAVAVVVEVPVVESSPPRVDSPPSPVVLDSGLVVGSGTAPLVSGPEVMAVVVASAVATVELVEGGPSGSTATGPSGHAARQSAASGA